MAGGGLMQQAFVFLGAAVVAVPVAKRLGLGSVLGYLIAGAIIGPYVLGWVGHDIGGVMHFAEFGVVMMLFLVGLELQPSLLWRLRIPIVGLGGAQVLGTTGVITGVAYLCGLDIKMALAVGMVLALSSTAIVLQTLNEKGVMKTDVGQSSFAVLLFQDIAVIPMLALLPLLAMPGGGTAREATGSGWLQALTVLAVVGGIILAGRFLVRPLFRIIANTKMREIFTATALFLVIGIALLMNAVGLSAALGTFLAGVVLADSEYRHELEAEIEPFKGLLLGLFFISVGASINFSILADQPGLISALVLGLIGVKMGVLFVLSRVFCMDKPASVFFSFALAQGGEFCFVLFSFASQNHVISEEVSSPLVVVVALSMALTPLLMIVNDRLIQPLLVKDSSEPQEADAIDDGDTPVIVAGMGRFGQMVSRLLQMKGFATTILEHDASQIEMVRRFGNKAFFGDASRVDLLHSAGANEAKLIVVAVDEHEKALEITQNIKKHFPHLKVYARAEGRRQYHELELAGADCIVRETFHSAVQMGEEALAALGMRKHEAHRAAMTFKKHDEQHIKEMTEVWGDEKGYISKTLKNTAALEEVLRQDKRDRDVLNEIEGWKKIRDAGSK